MKPKLKVGDYAEVIKNDTIYNHRIGEIVRVQSIEADSIYPYCVTDSQWKMNDTEPRKVNPPMTLEDALFETGAPDEIILLAMIEACLQNDDKSIQIKYTGAHPFCAIMFWNQTQQEDEFWFQIDKHYFIRTP